MFSVHDGAVAYELIEVVIACTRLVKDEARHNLSMSRGGGHKRIYIEVSLLATEE